MKYEVIWSSNKPLDDGRAAKKTLILAENNKHFLVSEVDLPFGFGSSSREAMIFACDEEGNVTSYSDLVVASNSEKALKRFQSMSVKDLDVNLDDD
jgi:hypothetical protein